MVAFELKVSFVYLIPMLKKKWLGFELDCVSYEEFLELLILYYFL